MNTVIVKAINEILNIDLSQCQITLADVISKVKDKANLDKKEVTFATCALMRDDCPQELIADYLTALHEKGETEEEIATSALVMRIFAEKIYTDETKQAYERLRTVDCCGTGGGVNIFNISTAVSLIVAAGGEYVAKHGNRAITSKSGSADFFESLGINIDVPPQRVGECILNNHIGFLFAPRFHQATKNVQRVRKLLPHKTIFNILGPLTNPANPTYQIIGVYDPALTEKIAKVLKLMGIKKAFVVHGFTPCGTGMDEVSTLADTQVTALNTDGSIATSLFNCEDVGIQKTTLASLQKKSKDETLQCVRDVLEGKIQGPEADIIVLNAAFTFLACERIDSIQAGIELAHETIREGKCMKTVKDIVAFTNA